MCHGKRMADPPTPPPVRSRPPLAQVRDAIRVRHESPRTAEAYGTWVRRFVLLHGKRHPNELGAPKVEAFLSHLATEKHGSASTQNQELAALLFLDVHGLSRPLGDRRDFPRAKRPHRSPQAQTGGMLPDALAQKFPNAGREWPWPWVFPATRTYEDPDSGQVRRHHLHETVLQKAVREAVLAAGLSNRAGCHTRRNAFATHWLEAGYDIGTIQERLGHGNVSTTMIDTHVLNRGPSGYGAR